MLPKRLKDYQCYISSSTYRKCGCNTGAAAALERYEKAQKKAEKRAQTAAIITGCLSLGTTLAVAAIKRSNAAAVENQKKTAATTQTLTQYQTACTTINTIGESGGTGTLGQAEKELESLQNDLKLATDDSAKEAALKEQDDKQTALDNEAGINDSNKNDAQYNVTVYNNLQKEKSTLTSLAQQLPALDKNISSAQTAKTNADAGVKSAENAYSSATFMKSDIKPSKGQAVSAVNNGGYTQEEIEAGKKSTDLKTAQKLDDDYNKALQEQTNAQTALDNAKQARTDALTGSGISGIGANSTIDNINAKLDGVNEDLAEFGKGSVTDVNSDSGMSVEDYAAKSANISKEKSRINNLSKTEIEAKIEAKKAEITGLKSQLEAAKAEKAKLEPEVQKIGTAAANLNTTSGALATEKAEYKNSKKLGANGQKRTFWQRMLARNRDKTNIKQQKAEYKEAKANASAAATTYSSSYGTLTDEEKQYLASLGYNTSD